MLIYSYLRYTFSDLNSLHFWKNMYAFISALYALNTRTWGHQNYKLKKVCADLEDGAMMQRSSGHWHSLESCSIPKLWPISWATVVATRPTTALWSILTPPENSNVQMGPFRAFPTTPPSNCVLLLKKGGSGEIKCYYLLWFHMKFLRPRGLASTYNKSYRLF